MKNTEPLDCQGVPPNGKGKISIRLPSNYEIYKKERKTWKINPKTKIKESKKVYNRKLTKKEIDKFRKEEDY